MHNNIAHSFLPLLATASTSTPNSYSNPKGRLVQYKKLLEDLIPLEKEVMRDIKAVLKQLQEDKALNISELVSQRLKETDSALASAPQILKPRKKLRILEAPSLEEKLDKSPEATEDEYDENNEENEERRAINYQIAKNKGLTPKRNKLQRNPRVKHRVKFEKAKIRRKGQIRTVRTEVKKYSGEISGINARVKKGIKLA
ncbi:Uncharacterized protein FKW44_000770 [Caligus rogercresseyi]|uniref:Sas10 C-terminal domain-containing protein n=1 Tax=Caligus rogercresseyi TaxID=217165 RepID=A0A7T8KHS7_CALRO|nr:Uncharacterized protein FKW44_000770 [Caligus rogercresseyi]